MEVAAILLLQVEQLLVILIKGLAMFLAVLSRIVSAKLLLELLEGVVAGVLVVGAVGYQDQSA